MIKDWKCELTVVLLSTIKEGSLSVSSPSFADLLGVTTARLYRHDVAQYHLHAFTTNYRCMQCVYQQTGFKGQK